MFKTNRIYFEVEGKKFMAERYTDWNDEDNCKLSGWSPYWETYCPCKDNEDQYIIFKTPKTKREMLNTAKILAKKNVVKFA